MMLFRMWANITFDKSTEIFVGDIFPHHQKGDYTRRRSKTYVFNMYSRLVSKGNTLNLLRQQQNCPTDKGLYFTHVVSNIYVVQISITLGAGYYYIHWRSKIMRLWVQDLDQIRAEG